MILQRLALALAVLAVAGCSREMPTQPSAQAPSSLRSTAPATALQRVATPLAGKPAATGPGYEPAYEDGNTVTIDAIEISGKVPAIAQADFYEVVYPPDWAALGIAPPQCNPCDHDGNGIDFLDYHDHVLDSAPGDVGYRTPWHVYAIVPAYNGDTTHDAAIGALYKAHLPIKSEADINDFLAMHLPSGAPVAVKVDTQFFFLCSVVSPHAVH